MWADAVACAIVTDDPIGHVVSMNLRRRHLNASQRAMVAARIANLKHGQRADRVAASIDAATRMLNVGEATVKRAKAVKREAIPELVEMVESWRTRRLGRRRPRQAPRR